MYEVELKVEADHDRVRAALDDAGAELVGRRCQVDTYYDAPHREFAETDEALRLREETDLATDGTTTKLTYKGSLVEAESKTREEHETAVADGDAAAGILDGLGFEPAATVEKERTFFELGGYTVTLDAVDGLGPSASRMESDAVDGLGPSASRMESDAVDGLGPSASRMESDAVDGLGPSASRTESDDGDGVGEFVEVEQEAPETEIEPVREGAQELLRELGLDPADQIRTSYLGLLLGDAHE